MNDSPTGSPATSPIGTVRLGTPATAATDEFPPVYRSPLTRSVGHDGPLDGATTASSRSAASSASTPSVPASRRQVASASRYAGASTPAVPSARSSSSCANHGMVRGALARLKAITSASVRTVTVSPREARYAFTPALNSCSITVSSASSYRPTLGTVTGSTTSAPSRRSTATAASNCASTAGWNPPR